MKSGCKQNRGTFRVIFKGMVGERIRLNVANWLLPAPYANPAMFEMFRMRDRQPRAALVAWYGEFPGKYLVTAVQAWKQTKDEQLLEVIAYTVASFEEVQDTDGYLGVHPYKERIFGAPHPDRSGDPAIWDVWGHYYCMLGLFMWHRESGSQQAYEIGKRAADYLCDIFLAGDRSIAEIRCEEMNMAVIHFYCLLYQLTENDRYLKMVRHIEQAWEHESAGDYVRQSLQGIEFYRMPKPRWESLPNVQAIAELYFITKEEKYKKAFEHIWWSIVETDRHNTGGFSSGEAAQGNPYDPRAIETCCTVAWMALTCDMYRLTKNPYVIDELELSTYNGMLGAQHPSGRWWTYDTPMDGVRKASGHRLVFQAMEASPELNCCSVHGPRGLGMLTDWAFLQEEEKIYVNYYGPFVHHFTLLSGQEATMNLVSDYPLDGEASLLIHLEKTERFQLNLRIPAWSTNTTVKLNGSPIARPDPGSYCQIDREWNDGDRIRLSLDFSLHFWKGEREAAGKVSLYRGPLLFAFDARFNAMDTHEVPVLPLHRMAYAVERCDKYPQPGILLRFKEYNGPELVLCDFASAGTAGTRYISWLPIRDRHEIESGSLPIWNHKYKPYMREETADD